MNIELWIFFWECTQNDVFVFFIYLFPVNSGSSFIVWMSNRENIGWFKVLAGNIT